MLNIKLTEVSNFHSHYENMSSIPVEDLHNRPVLSGKGDNLITLPALFPLKNDPLKFRSLHCYLFPNQCQYV